MMRYHDQHQLGEERTLGYTLSTGNQGRNSSRELKQRLQRNAAYWFAPHSLLSLLSYTVLDQLPRGAPSTSVINQDNTLVTHWPHTGPTGQAYGGIFSIKIPFS